MLHIYIRDSFVFPRANIGFEAMNMLNIRLDYCIKLDLRRKPIDLDISLRKFPFVYERSRHIRQISRIMTIIGGRIQRNSLFFKQKDPCSDFYELLGRFDSTPLS